MKRKQEREQGESFSCSSILSALSAVQGVHYQPNHLDELRKLNDDLLISAISWEGASEYEPFQGQE